MPAPHGSSNTNPAAPNNDTLQWGGPVAPLSATPSVNAIPLHTITCDGYPNQPLLINSIVFATAYVYCTDNPDIYSATLTIWAYYLGHYHDLGQRTFTGPASPNAEFSLQVGQCQHNWIYHAELEISAFHGNWIHEIANSTALTLC